MKIRFTTGVAGPRFSYEHDEVVELPEAVARQFIRDRQAVPAEERQAAPVEEATVAAPETADARRGRGRRMLNKLLGE